MVWPKDPLAHHEKDTFTGDFRHGLERDHEMYNYHYNIEHDAFDQDYEEHQFYQKYEDPHMHAPLRKQHEDPLSDEKAPTGDDFYTFDWHTIHREPLHETHLMPLSEHHQAKETHDKKKSEPTHQEVPKKSDKPQPAAKAAPVK